MTISPALQWSCSPYSGPHPPRSCCKNLEGPFGFGHLTPEPGCMASDAHWQGRSCLLAFAGVRGCVSCMFAWMLFLFTLSQCFLRQESEKRHVVKPLDASLPWGVVDLDAYACTVPVRHYFVFHAPTRRRVALGRRQACAISAYALQVCLTSQWSICKSC